MRGAYIKQVVPDTTCFIAMFCYISASTRAWAATTRRNIVSG